MKSNYYYRSRLKHLFICLLLSLTYLWLINFTNSTLLIILCSAFLGYLIGLFDWKRIQQRIDKRNVVILYYADGILYSLLIVIFLLQHISLFKLFKFMTAYSSIIEISIGAYITFCLGYNLSIYINSKKYELTHGKLITKYFYSKSVSGAEGMISKKGIVNSAETVKVGNEIWNAVSIDGQQINIGDEVIIRDIEGLKLVIERIV